MSKKQSKIQIPRTFSDEPKGLVIAYIGAGKGKTTAAMGLAARASGAGMNVFILQFVKATPTSSAKKEEGEWPVSSEIDFFNNISYPSAVGKIETEQVGLGFVGILGDKKQRETHMRQALLGVERAREIITSGEYHLVILDEIISTLELKLIQERDILDLISIKPKDVHLAMTGHNKFPKIMKVCDLVTEMKMLKHPYYKGMLAQKGIDY
jgi:cob(I)alamin adenosyltransferase